MTSMIQQPTYSPHHTDLLSPFQREGQQIYDQSIYDRLQITPQQLMEFCQKWQIAELAVFGSILRDDFRVGGDDPSDVDFLYLFTEGVRYSLFDVMHLREELEAILDRKVDFVSKTAIQNSRNWLRRKEILESGMIIYEKRSAIIA